MRNGRPNKIPHVKKLLKEECTKIIILTRVRTLNKKFSIMITRSCFYEQCLFFTILVNKYGLREERAAYSDKGEFEKSLKNHLCCNISCSKGDFYKIKAFERPLLHFA